MVTRSNVLRGKNKTVAKVKNNGRSALGSLLAFVPRLQATDYYCSVQQQYYQCHSHHHHRAASTNTASTTGSSVNCNQQRNK